VQASKKTTPSYPRALYRPDELAASGSAKSLSSAMSVMMPGMISVLMGLKICVLRASILLACDSLSTSLMYTSTALLFHRPSSLTSSFERPTAMAETVAPLRSECPEYFAGLTPIRKSKLLILSTRWVRLKGRPADRRNSGDSGVAG
jgi:hypothetical protein